MRILKSIGVGVSVWILLTLVIPFGVDARNIIALVSLVTMVCAFFFFRDGVRALEPIAKAAGQASAKAEKVTAVLADAFQEGRKSGKQDN